MRVRVPMAGADLAYERLRDFKAYPRYATSVRSVTDVAGPGEHPATGWVTDFRGGILKWIEEDRLDPGGHRIEFRQLSGDLDVFDGLWRIDPDPEPGWQVVYFHSRFDLGIPTLEDVLEPIAEEALYENIAAIVAGLFGPGTEVVEAYGSPVGPVGEVAGR
jgi:hypothetical protein